MASRAAREFEVLYRRLQEDIFVLCKALRFVPTSQQAVILERVNQAKREGNLRNFMAVKSGQGNGKSAVAFIIALFRVLQAPKSLAVLTAPTQRQCRDAFLTRGREIMAAADPAIQRIVEVRASKVEICRDKDWGIKTVTATDPKNAQGYHVPYERFGSTLSIIMEEMSGIDREIVEQFKGTISDPDVLMLGIGNPNLRDCSFFDCFNSLRHMWWTYTLNSEVTARENPTVLDPARNEEIAEEFGVESDVYRIRVLGEFPWQDPDSVISSEDLEACTKTDLVRLSRIERPATFALPGRAHQFGLDFARYGGDETAIYQRLGYAILDYFVRSHVDPNDAVDKAFAMQVGMGWKNKDTWFVGDAGGLGGGVMGNFHRVGKQLLEWHNEGVPSNREYANLITEGWFHVGRLAKARRLHIPNDRRLIQQLSTRKYTTNKQGQLIVWTKDQYIKDGHDSPDRAEGCIMAFYDAITMAGRSVRQRPGKRAGAEVRHHNRGGHVGMVVRK